MNYNNIKLLVNREIIGVESSQKVQLSNNKKKKILCTHAEAFQLYLVRNISVTSESLLPYPDTFAIWLKDCWKWCKIQIKQNKTNLVMGLKRLVVDW